MCPQISYASTSTALSDKEKYEYFARTVPSDKYQARALVDLVSFYNWSYVSLVSSEGQYGESGSSEFTMYARNRGICIAVHEKVPQRGNDTKFDRIVDNLLRKEKAKTVVLFLRMEDAKGLLRAAKRRNVGSRFSWVASDGWGKEMKVVEDLGDVAIGALTLELSSKTIEEFDKYLLNLDVQTNTRNPWFKEFWQEALNCKLKRHLFENDGDIPCSPDLRLTDLIDYLQESKVQFVIDAVYAFAHAIHNAWNDLCNSINTICPELKQLDPLIFYKKYLLNVRFKGKKRFHKLANDK